MKLRKPAVAGTFYAGTAEELREQIELCYRHELGPRAMPQVNSQGIREIVAIVAPHAGYYYSGPVAAHAYKELANDGVFDAAIILGPNHSGFGPLVSLWAEGAWETPLGRVEIDESLSSQLLKEAAGTIEADETAHIHEHSIEVQLPWLQHIYGELKIVPIAMLAQDINTARAIGEAISTIADNIVIIASSDFSHYEPGPVARDKDRSVIEAIIDLDEEELYERRESVDSTMCGYGPIASAIVAAKGMKAKGATLLKYATSGDATGDFSRVVGYGSIVIR
jgi:AmmeMemoRadiSam system protein B